MAQNYVFNTLTKVLGEFIEISEDNLILSGAVSSGQIVLKNLKLKNHTIFKSMNVDIVHGSISILEINIPWLALWKSPVQILIDGVYLLIAPSVKKAGASTESVFEVWKKELSRKLDKLELADKLMDISDDDSVGVESSTGKAANGSSSGGSGGGGAVGSGYFGGYFQSIGAGIVTKVVDNLEVTLKNVHIRYEDDLSIPNTHIAAGLTLSAFTLISCNSNWQEAFVARGSTAESKIMRKLAKIQSMAIYWNCNNSSSLSSSSSTGFSSLRSLDFHSWLEAMHKFIVKSENAKSPKSLSGPLHYILEPRNLLAVKMTHNENYGQSNPKFLFDIESTNLPLAVDGLQCLQITQVIKYHKGRGETKFMRSFKPKDRRPTSPENAALWWKYVINVFAKKKRYIQLIKIVKSQSKYESDIAISGGEKTGMGIGSGILCLSAQENEELNFLEEKIPLHALIIFRNDAIKELKLEEDLRRAQAQYSTAFASSAAGGNEGSSSSMHSALHQKQGWGSWIFGGKGVDPNNASNIKPSEDIPLESIISKLKEEAATPRSDANFEFMRLKINSSSSLDLSLNGNSIFRAKMALQLDARVFNNGVNVKADLVDMYVEDKCTKSPTIPQIISVKRAKLAPTFQPSMTSSAPMVAAVLSSVRSVMGGDVSRFESAGFSVEYESFRGKSKAIIKALPFIFSLNKTCIQHIMATLDFIKQKDPNDSNINQQSNNSNSNSSASDSSKSQSRSSNYNSSSNHSNGNHLFNFKPSHSDFEVVFEAHAPKIIIPEDASADKGYLLLDTGFLVVNGFTGPEGMNWDVKLTKINAAMPVSFKNLHDADIDNDLYLIKPFDLSVNLQNIDKSFGDMDLKVSITPEIRGELTANKLSRLLKCIGEVTASFTKPPDNIKDLLPPLIAHCASSTHLPVPVGIFPIAAERFLPDRNSPSPNLGNSSSNSIINKSSNNNGRRADSYSDHDETSYSSSKVTGEHDKLLPFAIEKDSDDDSDDDSDLAFATPPSSDNELENDNSTYRHNQRHQRVDVDYRDPIPASSASGGGGGAGRNSSTASSAGQAAPPRNNMGIAELVSVRVRAEVPAIILDLKYDEDQGLHSILTLSNLSITVVNRKFDMSIAFTMEALSIEDSMRSESQRYLARTIIDKSTHQQLVEIKYVKINSPLSPYYTGMFGTDILVNFASLDLTCDVNTVRHLKPFTEVLLKKDPAPQLDPTSPSASAGNSSNSSNNGSSAGGGGAWSPLRRTVMNAITGGGYAEQDIIGSGGADVDAMALLKPPEVTGLRFVLAMDKLTLSLLRASKGKRKGEDLDWAFTLKISKLFADIQKDHLDLLSADVKLKSLEVIDLREITKDFVFRTVLCPFIQNDKSSSSRDSGNGSGSTSPTKINRTNSNDNLSTASPKTSPGGVEERNILQVFYKQASKTNNGGQNVFIDILVMDIAAFVAIDTILDVYDVFFDNFLEILDLLASDSNSSNGSGSGSGNSSNNGNSDTNEFSNSSNRSNEFNKNAAEEETILAVPSTMSLNVRVENPRLIILDDPTIDDCESLVATCAIEVHFAKEEIKKQVKNPKASNYYMLDKDMGWFNRKDVQESLHVTLKRLEIFVIRDMTKWYPQPILNPLGLEFHMKKRSVNDSGEGIDIKVDMDEADAKITLRDVLLAQSILSRRLIGNADDLDDNAGNNNSANNGAGNTPFKALNSSNNNDNYGNNGNNNNNNNSISVITSSPSPKMMAINNNSPLPSSSKASSSDGHLNASVTSPERPESPTSPISPSKNRAEVEHNLEINVNIGNIKLMMVNDHKGKNIPVLRTTLEDTVFHAEGWNKLDVLEGEGSITISTDFYNADLGVWEPVIEPWMPTISILSEPSKNNKLFKLKTDKTLQLTVSGAILEQLADAIILLSVRDHLDFREPAADLKIINHLGENVNISVSASACGTHLVDLEGNDSAVCPKVAENGRKSWFIHKPHQLPKAVDIHFKGTLENERRSLYHLPFNIRKPKVFHLVPINLSNKKNSSANPGETVLKPSSSYSTLLDSKPTLIDKETIVDSNSSSGSDYDIVLEPIEEEAYENSRYDPLTGRWRSPYLYGDPDTWTDASGTISRDIATVSLPTNGKWEWLDIWKPDVQGVVGTEVDQDGWEYSTGFSSFSIASKGRAQLSMDCVRRRRWVRVRGPTALLINERVRPLNVIWDVQVKTDGSREAHLRSVLQIHNILPISIQISLQYSTWRADVLLGPIAPNELFNVPLLYSFATTVKIRPYYTNSTVDYVWSKPMPCNVQQYDFRTVRNITSDVNSSGIGSKPTSPTSSGGSSGDFGTISAPLSVATPKGDKEHQRVSFRIISEQKAKALILKILPHITLTNALPCSLKFKCISEDGLKESGDLKCGETLKLKYMNILQSPSVKFQVGKLGWSEWSKILSFKDKKNSNIIELLSGGKTALVLTCRYSNSGDGNCADFCIFSKGAFIDYSGLNLSLSSCYLPGQSLDRYSYSRDLHLNSSGGDASHVSGNNNNGSGDKNKSNSSGGEYINMLTHSSTRDRARIRDKDRDRGRSAAGFAALGTSGHLDFADSDINYLIRDVVVDSRRRVGYSRVNKGELVYSDRESRRGVRWSYIPSFLTNAWSITVASNENMSRSRHFVQFRLIYPSIVLILVDLKIDPVPKWLQDEGYAKTVENAVSRQVVDGKLVEYHFAIYGRYIDLLKDEDEQIVILKGNWNKYRGAMYVPIIIPNPCFENFILPHVVTHDQSILDAKQASFDSLLYQIKYNATYSQEQADRAWTEGSMCVSLFHSYDDKVVVGANLEEGYAFSDELNISLANNTHTGYIEVLDNMFGYQLFYSLSTLPGVYSDTQTFTLMPRYLIVNCMEENILVHQAGSLDGFVVGPYQSEPWHKADIRLATSIQIRCETTELSLASIDINEVGSSIIYLPRKAGNDSSSSSVNPNSSRSRLNREPVVVHVEVRQATANDRCAVAVIIWRATVEGHCGISIRNEIDLPVTVIQADVPYADPRVHELTIGPNQSIPFGWSDPDRGHNIMITVGDSISMAPSASSSSLSSLASGGGGGGQSKRRIATISLMKTGEKLRLPDNTGRHGPVGEVLLSVITENGGRVLKISRVLQESRSNISSSSSSSSNYSSTASSVSTPINAASSLAFDVSLASFGISLIIDQPTRREYLSLYVDSLQAIYMKKGLLQSFEFEILDLQIDNYSETMVYPVLLHSTKLDVYNSVNVGLDDLDENYGDETPEDASGQPSPKSMRREMRRNSDSEETQPLLVVSVIKDVSLDSSTPMYRYICMRLLPLVLEVDSSTLQMLYFDLIKPLKFISSANTLSSTDPQQWIYAYNKQILSPDNQKHRISVFQAKSATQASRIFVEKLVVHPIKVILTFIQTPLPKVMTDKLVSSTMINILTTFAAVDKMQLKLKSFDVEDVMETKASLAAFVVNRVLQDLQSQLAQIAGSLSVLGSPLGFARKVGSGVKAFFYEPYQGMVHGPQDFVVGLGKGASSLFSGVISGAMNSTVAFFSTATKGISYLSVDEEYIRKHELKRQQHRAHNLVDSILDGGDSLMSGITSGVSGLFMKPFEEGSKKGAMGFLKGIGLGLIGAVVKPAMGITEGITCVANGISRSVETTLYDHARPPRSLGRSPFDSTKLQIVVLNISSAHAQKFVVDRAKANNYDDSFMSYIAMKDPGEAVILSEIYLYWDRKTPKTLWGRTWSNISHCLFMGDSVGIMLYSHSEKGKPEAVAIPCGSRAKALELYSAISKSAHRMGNPALVVPVDILDGANDGAVASGGGGTNSADQSRSTRDIGSAKSNYDEIIARQGRSASLAGELDSYRFGSVNDTQLTQITGPESDVLQRAAHYLSSEYETLRQLDQRLWQLIWEWECTHMNIQASRCCVTLIINRSQTPIQISRVQIVLGKNVIAFGSTKTGYDSDSRLLLPNGIVAIFLWAFHPTPIESGHLCANINSAAFNAAVASTQRDSKCESRAGFSVGFLEKSVSEWWSKYVILVD